MDFLEKFDKQKLQKITLIVIAALTLIALLLLLAIIVLSVEGNSDRGGILGNNDIDMEFEDITLEASQDKLGSLVLVNGTHKYDIPDELNLVKIFDYRASNSDGSSTYNLTDSSPRLEATAMTYLHKMLVQLGKDTDNHSIMISSAFRTHEDQANLGTSIAAGYSDSHTGLIVALTVYKGVSPYLYDESNSVLESWLNQNCHKYGFVVRYPADKVEITGVDDYTYAFRYVGIPHAKYMVDNNLCLEEYVEYLKNNTSYNEPLSITADDGSTYYVYYTEASSGDVIKVPAKTANPDGSMNFDYTISGTNDGGVVVTVKVK